MAASTCASDPLAVPVVALANYDWTPPGAARPALSDVSLQIRQGECVLVTGPTGAGKSTLLRAIAGMLPPGGFTRGDRMVTDRATLLFQDIDPQLLFSTVEEEVASGMAGDLEDASRSSRVDAALTAVALDGFARRAVDDLSAGERQRVVLAALLAREPSLLLLDEPTSALDPAGRRRLAETLAALHACGHTLIIAEHVTAPFRSLANRVVCVANGCVVERPALETGLRALRPPLRPSERSGRRVIRVCGVEVRDADGRIRVSAPDFHVDQGERVLVYGANGAGKSTLLRVLAGLVRASQGRVEFGEALRSRDSGDPRARPGRIALVLQNPARNLFAHDVGEELAFTLQRARWPAARTKSRVRELLAACDLVRVGDRSPLRLSFGEQHRVAIAAALASEPALLLLDEPFPGLDPHSRQRLLEWLDREQAHTGMAVIIASQDREGTEGWRQREIALPPPCDARRGRTSEARARECSEDRNGARSEVRKLHPRVAAAGRSCHYRDTGSPVHGMGAGWKLLAVSLGGAAAIAARGPIALTLLLGAWLAGYRVARLSAAELWQDTRWLLAQGLAIIGLTVLREGTSGVASGLHTAVQIALFFLPGALLLRTTPTGRLLESAKRALPPRFAFALATSLRFVPFFAREFHEIAAVQQLRGARLAPRGAWRPGFWRDAIECLGVPLAVRAIYTASEVAQAADVRGIAAARERS